MIFFAKSRVQGGSETLAGSAAGVGLGESESNA
jgi:hypothetical protein